MIILTYQYSKLGRKDGNNIVGVRFKAQNDNLICLGHL
jgi:hypothetical protein